MYIKIFEDKELHQSAKEGIIALLEKAGKDQLKINSWRPLSLLCVDLKILTKIISNRLQLVADTLIHQDQCVFLKGRFIAQNLLDLLLVIESTDRKQEPGLIITIDYEKAYDTVEWTAITKLLRLYGFGENIIRWIEACQTNIFSRVINNGKWSNRLEIKRGLRQGDPLSCILFDLVIEAIACKIRNNPNIKGIKVGVREKLLGQYADDFWLSIQNEQKSFNEVFCTFRLFTDFCGLKINYDKNRNITNRISKGFRCKIYL